MTARDRRFPPIADHVEIADFGDELVALVPSSRHAVHLEAAHALVLDSCRHGHRMASVVAEIAAASGDEHDAIRDWIDGVLLELARVGVVAPG